jgi:elongation factor Ts
MSMAARSACWWCWKVGDENLAKDIAMHVAASRPEYVSQDQVPAAAVAKEKEIFAEQAKASGKPADIIEKMVMGRVNKYLGEITLLGPAVREGPGDHGRKNCSSPKAPA